MKKLLKIILMSTFGFFLCVGFSAAYETPVLHHDASTGYTETSLNTILSDLYGTGNFSRVADDLDQLWEPVSDQGVFQFAVKYAGHMHDFGYFEEGSDTFIAIIQDAGVEFEGIDADAIYTTSLPATFYFGIHDQNDNTYWSSNVNDNNPDYDHMVTYQITTDPLILYHYVIAFEDLNLGDMDYNDLVIDVQLVRPVAPVPEPATMLLLGTGLIGLAGVGRKKFIK